MITNNWECINKNYKNSDFINNPNRINIACILAYYKGQKYIKQQIKSIVNQNLNNVSLTIFISEDCSNENSSIFKSSFFNNIKNFQIFHRKCSKKLGYALNFLNALKDINKEFDYYCFSDQDDIWLPNKLENALKKIHNHSTKDPILYCGRTTYYDENCKNKLGDSILFKKKPCFKNAIVQSIAGGNTMFFNKTSADLIISSIYNNFRTVSHDWWCYQIISGAGGKIFYDKNSYVKYRQHKNNLLGSNNTFSDVTFRIFFIIIGKWKTWNNINLISLCKNKHLLTKENQFTLEKFRSLRKEKFFKRFYLFLSCGVFRQTIFGNTALAFAIVFNRV